MVYISLTNYSYREEYGEHHYALVVLAGMAVMAAALFCLPDMSPDWQITHKKANDYQLE
jgi:hypothetical protein